MSSPRPVMLLALGQSGWEAEVIANVVSALPDVDVRRTVGVSDLLAVATAADVRAVVLDANFPRLDASVVAKLADFDVAMFGLAADARELHRLEGLGIETIVPVVPGEVPEAVEQICSHWRHTRTQGPVAQAAAPPANSHLASRRALQRAHHGQLMAVWGPPGAPGRTTIAITLAQLLAQDGADVLLADADTNSAGIGPSLCLEAEGSGLIAACHHAERGSLDDRTLARLARQVDDRFRVLTGISHVSRRSELRAAAMSRVWQVAAGLTDAVVVDIGGCVDDGSLALEADVADFGINSSGHSAAVTALGAADELVAVSSCEPTSVARLLSHLPAISSLAPAARLHVVINRVRAPIVRNQGAADELRRFVATHTRAHEVVLVREDRETVDAAAARGLTPYEHSRKATFVREVATLSRGLQSPLVATA